MEDRTMKYQIESVMDVAAIHMTKADWKSLRRGDGMLCAYKLEDFGFLVAVPWEEKGEIDGLRESGAISSTFADILNAAFEAGCRYVKIDVDGMEYDHLPKFK
jgi:hypothetical protein